MAELSGVEVLQSEIEKAKDKLRNYNENIKKLTGRDPSRPGIRRILSGEGGEREEDGFNGRNARGRGRLFGMARRGIMEDNGPPSKRRVIGGAFSRLGPVPVAGRRREREDSPYEEELPNKLSVQSSVVSTSREAKNRQEIMQEQTKDKEGMQRNRRMFGLLLGTLNKFKTESKTLETKEVQRKKIEEKLEENAEKEKRKFKQETKLLMEEMHLEQSKISRLQQKMEMVQEHSEREAEMEKLKNFIATKTKPRIFWKPVQSSTLIENKLKDSKKVVDDLLQEGRDRLEKEIKELMEREYKREERIKMRLREDGLLGDEEEGAGDENAKNKTSGEAVGENREEQVKLEEENTGLSSRLGRHVELKNTEGEHEDETREWDSKKRTRRTVVVEKEGSQSDSDESLDMGKGEGDNSKVDGSKTSSAQKKKHIKDAIVSNQSSDEDMEQINIKQERQEVVRVAEREIRRRPVDSQERHVDKERDKGGDEDGVEDARERLRDKRHEEKRDKRKEVSEERDRRRHRRGEEKMRHDSSERVGSSRDKERSHRESREDRREKDKKGGHENERRHVSHRTKDKRRNSESSSESEVEIKREKKDDRDIKGKKVKDHYKHSDMKSGNREGGFDKESEGKNKNKIPDNTDVLLDSDNEATE